MHLLAVDSILGSILEVRSVHVGLLSRSTHIISPIEVLEYWGLIEREVRVQGARTLLEMINFDKLSLYEIDQTLIKHLVVVVVQVEMLDMSQVRHEARDKLRDRICLVHQ